MAKIARIPNRNRQQIGERVRKATRSRLLRRAEENPGSCSRRSLTEKIAPRFVNGRGDARNDAEVVPLLAAVDGEPANGLEQPMSFQEKLHAAQEGMQAGKKSQLWCVKAVTQFLEDPESSFAAMCYGYFITWFNIFAIFIGLLPFADLQVPAPGDVYLDSGIDSVLFTEITAWLLNCRGGSSDCEMLGTHILVVVVPVIRLMRLVRRFPAMQILISAFRNCLEALPVLLYTMAILACFFTSMIYLVERDNLSSMSEAAWLVLSTMTTVGYGDVVPHSQSGRALASLLMIVSSLYMAMPFGIIGYSFTAIWGNRTQILLLQGTRDRLAKWGFGPYEIPRLFQLFDLDSSSEIDLQEFQILLAEMEIGFREQDAIELFKAIDKDSGGTIDEKEFVKTLYPAEYRYMYGGRKKVDG